MKDYLIVDGYNIIGAWPELAKLRDIRLEDARDRLIDILSDYRGYSDMTIYLVFDAYQIPGHGGKYEHSKLHVVYTKEKETADELIERLVSDLTGRRRQVYVATSDMTEQHVVFGRGALRISARELLIKVRESRKDIRKQINESTHSRNTFDSKISQDTRDVLEKWRRGDK
ncbi:MAG: NYN domain-containing protein [Gorillibacterium sp.]|nr:NYN domain-containing protein [Gorillibacterium sp.]